jgi:hypothetical protein
VAANQINPFAKRGLSTRARDALLNDGMTTVGALYPEPMRKRKKRTREPRPGVDPAFSLRIEALMDVSGYDSQENFAAQLEGVSYERFNNIAAGRNNLSRTVADAIFFAGQAGYP